MGEDRWTQVKRSKAFIADKYFPPFEMKEGNMRNLLSQKDAYTASEDSEIYQAWKEKMLEGIP
jgi:hypothetical protein